VEAAELYVSIFKNSKIISSGVMIVKFELEGQEFFALNGGPTYTFSPAISLFVDCESQAEIDDLTEKLTAGGEQQRCGWVRDKYGLSWQIVPSILGELMQSDDERKAQSVMDEMLTMMKLDIARLQAAYDRA
jgi:predicted 3-demethylubiquinone-9 3-methyltransferase (glyoxalase superfamily)